jgi:hypothetical protein
MAMRFGKLPVVTDVIDEIVLQYGGHWESTGREKDPE